jgi:aspartyl-tRNA(Asn)/glutamyl-tRNA(Gln) amidotransferase subunit B
MQNLQSVEWESIIGLEVHIQLLTNSKLFSGAPTTYGADPNTQACAVDLALPGVLPALNRTAVDMAIKFGLRIYRKVIRLVNLIFRWFPRVI